MPSPQDQAMQQLRGMAQGLEPKERKFGFARDLERLTDEPISALSDIVSQSFPGAQENISALAELLPGAGMKEGSALGQLASEQFSQGDYGSAALNALGGAASGALDMIPGGGLALKGAMFLGIGAKNADKGILKVAKDLTEQGASRDEVWKATGDMGQPWFKDVDDQWKFEIDDSKMTIDTDFSDFEVAPDKLTMGEIVDHPELFKAYPELNDLDINLRAPDPNNSDVRGSYSPTSDNMTLHPDFDEYDARSITAHEIDHSVQGREGFDQGTSPSAAQTTLGRSMNDARELYGMDAGQYGSLMQKSRLFSDADYFGKLDELSKSANPKPSSVRNLSDYYEYSDEISRRFGAMPKKPGNSRDEWVRSAAAMLRNKHELNVKNRYGWTDMQTFDSIKGDRKAAQKGNKKHRKEADKYLQASKEMAKAKSKHKTLAGMSDFEVYQRKAGEASARNVQTRLDMPMSERLATHPRKTLDVPEDELIVRGNNPVSALSAIVEKAR